jgi:hypothetical protein
VRLVWDPSPGGAASYHVYRSEGAGAPHVRLNSAPLPAPYYIDGTAEAGRTYRYAVTSTDAAGRESGLSAEIEVPVGKVERAPRGAGLVVRAGPDRLAASGAVVTLSGSGWAGGGRALSYAWTQVSGPPVVLVQSDRADASFLAPFAVQETVLGFSLTVGAGDLGTASDTVQVTIRPRK